MNSMLTNVDIAERRLHNQRLAATVHTQLQSDGTILRTHVLRPTWHFVAPADIRWMLELTAPRVSAFNAYYYRKCGLDAAVFQKSNATLTEALRGGKQLTRPELATASVFTPSANERSRLR